ncbi:hypothetical protein FRX31_007057 [Thalictrum thalictroides]|uniref:Transmembrane protein n=1 Tax=Thalictrum thalictroides TaxID=46969 RepID=A0A7J6X0V2_THATH|nr:hypothetical protein FRX31_007057 [Thalictrum thalictroides]
MESKSIMLTFLILCLVLSPTLPSSEAARFNQRELLQRRPICPACVCCPGPVPPGGCCRCGCNGSGPISRP